jgi:queuine/archaeosine tRNA-ribosyltransferase
VHFYQELMARAREAIAAGTFAAFAEDVCRRYAGTSEEEEPQQSDQ